MKYLFTGASGFIGSHFHEVLDNLLITNLDLEKPRFKNSANFFEGDIRKESDIEAVMSNGNFDILIHLAAQHKDFGIQYQEYFNTNHYGTKKLCDACSKYGIKKIVFYSSVAVYGANVTPSNEEDIPIPNMPYGESKWAGEKALLEWASEDPLREVLIIRPAVVYGERNVANMFRLIEQIKAGRYFHIGKGDNVKSIVYVKNLVQATLWLIDRMQPGVFTYNYADSPQLTSREIANIISDSLNKTPINLPYWLVYLMGIPFDLVIKLTGKDLPISTNRIKKFCTETYHKADKITKEGFVPKYSNKEGLQNMVKWMNDGRSTDEAIFDV